MRLQDRYGVLNPKWKATKKFGKLIRHKTWREYNVVDIYYNIWVVKNKKADQY